MPNIATALKSEITRLARKELKAHVEPLKKANASCRADIALLKKRVQELERALKRTDRNANAKPRSPAPPSDEVNTPLRFRREGMAKNRQRLGLSAADFGLLVGATGQSIYAWESGKSKPNRKYLAAIAALRGVGKREVSERLAQLKQAE